MRSSEFGSISISTSTTPDLISAQISLDHSELARTIAAHLPEMQTRLANNQGMDVQIGLNEDRGGHSAGTSGAMPNGGGAGGESRGGGYESRNASSNHFSNGLAGPQVSPAAAAKTTGDGRLFGRLDIRV
jgi:hypothetical protein